VKRVAWLILAGVLLAAAPTMASADPGDRHGRKEWKRDRDRHDRRYFGSRDVVVIREYYRPHYRPLPGARHRYYRSGYLPRGWHRRIRPMPAYIERDLVVLPRGDRRGILDGHAVVFDARGLIIDIAVLF